MFLGQARGRVGSVVFSRRMGVQVTRTYNSTPSNPKTRAQALQRAQFSTASVTATRLKEVISNSFDGVKNGQDSVNHFLSRNIKMLSESEAGKVFLTPKGARLFQPQPWVISSGSIGTILPTSLIDLGIHFSSPDEEALNPTRDATVNEFADQWYYRPGCQFTFIGVLWKPIQGAGFGTVEVLINRIVFNDLAPADMDAVLFSADEDGYNVKIPAAYCDLTKTDCEVVADPNDDTQKWVILPRYLHVDNNQLAADNARAFNRVIVNFGVITTYFKDGKYVHTNSTMGVNYDEYEFTVDAVATYMNSAKKVISSDYYTEQPDTDYNDWEVPTLEQVVSAQIQAIGMQAKGVYIGQSNSYGPVAEGVPITLAVDLPARFQIRANSVKAYNGETPLGNDWYITRSGSRGVVITGPMPTTTSFPFNVSFEVDDSYSGSHVGRAALRINVSKANS